ncbi:MAG: SoxR reducing system RseC family protein [Fibrobacterota bacterium]
MPLFEEVLRPGVIEKISDRSLQVLLDADRLRSVCNNTGCSACQKNFTPLRITIPRTRDNLSAGDGVVVSLTVLNEALAAFTAFMLPLIISLSFYITVWLFFSWPADAPGSIGGTLLALVVGIALVLQTDKLIRQFYPPVVREIKKQ